MTRTPLWRCGLALSAIALCSTSAEARYYPRDTPIVKAVASTRASVVSLSLCIGSSKREGVGTAVVIDERGYLLTANHVVKNADKITAHFADGSDMPASVVATERHEDLAILRVSTAKPLQALPLGPGSDLIVGEQVIAVGNPYGYGHTVSSGIISALGRDIEMPSGYTLKNLIQTTADINPGNSGGPLLNINGELIGIVVALRDGARGIAFVINAETIKGVLARQLSASKLAGFQHGLDCQEKVRPEGADRQQVIVQAVHEETPAARAGLKPGDVLRRVGERPVQNVFDVERALWDVRDDSRVDVTVMREGKEVNVQLAPRALAQR
jgi:serine protease Do